MSMILGVVVGLVAVIPVYLAFVFHEFLQAGQSGRALGIQGTLLSVFTHYSFILTAIVAFGLAFFKTTHVAR